MMLHKCRIVSHGTRRSEYSNWAGIGREIPEFSWQARLVASAGPGSDGFPAGSRDGQLPGCRNSVGNSCVADSLAFWPWAGRRAVASSNKDARGRRRGRASTTCLSKLVRNKFFTRVRFRPPMFRQAHGGRRQTERSRGSPDLRAPCLCSYDLLSSGVTTFKIPLPGRGHGGGRALRPNEPKTRSNPGLWACSGRIGRIDPRARGGRRRRPRGDRTNPKRCCLTMRWFARVCSASARAEPPRGSQPGRRGMATSWLAFPERAAAGQGPGAPAAIGHQ